MSRARTTRPKDCPYVGKGGLKLAFALERFGIDPGGLSCVDLGCNVGGFTDCLLQAGAARVHAVDTGYGVLAWKLRQDKRVVAVERTNVLHWDSADRFDLVVVDLGWTRQAHGLPVAGRLVRPGGTVLSLVKPQYEAPKHLLKRGVLDEQHHATVIADLARAIPPGLTVAGEARSPIAGSGGNVEHWLYLTAP